MNLFGYLVIPLLVAAVLAMVLAPVTKLFAPVGRRRLERFALRQALRITPDNGNVIIRYLATTRRWRGGLLWVTLLVSVTCYLVTRHRVDFSGVAAFGGWFAGAVIAEWRVDSLARGRRSAASLHRRRLGDYVPRAALLLVGVVWALLPVMCVVGSIEGRWPRGIAVLTVVLAVGAALTLVMRRVLDRPQPLAAPDLLEADNAVRSRSLCVLAGCALAIGGYVGAAAVEWVFPRPGEGPLGLIGLFGYVALPILGVIVARAPRLVPVLPAGQPIVA